MLYALIAGRALIAVVLAGRALISALLVVTAGIVLMAVILIVEDDVFIREIAEMMIQDWGHQTLLASDVDEALALLRSPQHIDALFTDIYLKTAVLGGCELALQAIKLRPDLRVLYTTGNTITEKMKALFVEGTHFLRKPYTQHQLQDSVKDLLAA
jgi:CheY-like chemotaxis protein